MEEEKPKKKRQKGAPTPAPSHSRGGEQKAHKTNSRQANGDASHKKNWRETSATPAEIKEFLSGHVYLRYNTVKHCNEVRLPPEDPFCANSELAQFAGDDWLPMSDRLANTLKNALCDIKPTQKRDLQDVLDSGFVPAFHPFGYYLSRLPPWDGQDYILELSMSVSVKGTVEKQMLFAEYLKRWMVAMVASWLDDETVNQAVLVLIGEQGLYKTTWFSRLLPPELNSYFRIKVKSGKVEKDDLIALSQYGLVCCEELDVMRPSEVNAMKTIVTMPAIDERVPYGRHPEHMPHVASFCGTGNNPLFLNDPTGSRRWLPFEVESIMSPHDNTLNYEGIYSQAYALYRRGFRYWFTKAEEKVLREHNRSFETPHQEQEAIAKYFRMPRDDERGQFYTATDILQTVGGSPAVRLRVEDIGSAMKALGYQQYRSHGRRGYRVVPYKTEEIESNRTQLAYDARPESEALASDPAAGGTGDTGVTVF